MSDGRFISIDTETARGTVVSTDTGTQEFWGAGVTTLGYFLGQIEFVKNNIEFILILVVALSVIPVVLEIRKAKREADSHQKPEPFENPIDEEGEPVHAENEA